MKSNRTVFASFLLFGAAGIVNAQINYNTVDFGAMMRNTQNNIINGARNRILAGGSGLENSEARAEYNRRLKAGTQKIESGRATTIFSSTEAGTQALANNISWDADEPQDLVGQIKFLQRSVQQFETLMKQNGFTPKDFADGYTFAYALAYAAQHNSDLDKNELTKLRKTRRDALTSNAFFQGSPDVDKQYIYEANINMVMQAVQWRVKARRATNPAERQLAEEKAKHYAKYLLGN